MVKFKGAFHRIMEGTFFLALPVSYCRLETFYIEKFARIILEATYEATLAAALINYKKNDSKKVFLTLVGRSAL